MEPVLTDDQRLTTSIQLNHPNDNAENVRLGVEYAWQNTFFLRGGVKRTIGQQLLGGGRDVGGELHARRGRPLVMGLTTRGRLCLCEFQPSRFGPPNFGDADVLAPGVIVLEKS